MPKEANENKSLLISSEIQDSESFYAFMTLD